MSEAKEKKKKSIGNSIATVLSWILMSLTILILIMTIINVSNPGKMSFFGLRVGIVATDSMEPTIKVSDIIFYNNGDFDDLEEGDIIVFQYVGSNSSLKGQSIVHRINRITKDGTIYTKGDNPNALEDPDPVTKDNYLGNYVWSSSFFGIGKLRKNGMTPIFIIIILAFLGIIISTIINIFKEINAEKVKKAKEEIIKEYVESKQIAETTSKKDDESESI